MSFETHKGQTIRSIISHSIHNTMMPKYNSHIPTSDCQTVLLDGLSAAGDQREANRPEAVTGLAAKHKSSSAVAFHLEVFVTTTGPQPCRSQ